MKSQRANFLSPASQAQIRQIRQGPMVRWLVTKGARVTGHELQLAAFGGYQRQVTQQVLWKRGKNGKKKKNKKGTENLDEKGGKELECFQTWRSWGSWDSNSTTMFRSIPQAHSHGHLEVISSRLNILNRSPHKTAGVWKPCWTITTKNFPLWRQVLATTCCTFFAWESWIFRRSAGDEILWETREANGSISMSHWKDPQRRLFSSGSWFLFF